VPLPPNRNRVEGLTFSHLMKLSYKRGYIDRESYVVQYLALALFTSGVVATIGSDDLLAAFAAGQFRSLS
jgi:sodium/hydrogen antiporter